MTANNNRVLCFSTNKHGVPSPPQARFDVTRQRAKPSLELTNLINKAVSIDRQRWG